MVYFTLKVYNKKSDECLVTLQCSMREGDDLHTFAYFYFGRYVSDNYLCFKPYDVELRIIDIKYDGKGLLVR